MVGRQIVGCVLTDEEADKFRAMLPEGVTTTDAIRGFVEQVSTGQMHIKELDLASWLLEAMRAVSEIDRGHYNKGREDAAEKIAEALVKWVIPCEHCPCECNTCSLPKEEECISNLRTWLKGVVEDDD